MILLDTSGLLAAIATDEPRHAESLTAFSSDQGPFVVSPFVLAEEDHHIVRRIGIGTELSLLANVAAGPYELAPFTIDDVGRAAVAIERYDNLAIGLADASIVVLAGRYGTNRVLTLDERHSRAMRTPQGDPFVVLPADA